jgi:peptide/nickel transport system substrate-binding protein
MLAWVAGPAPAAAAATRGGSSITLSEGVQVQINWWFPNDPGQYCDIENTMATNMAYRPLLWVSNRDAIQYNQSIATGITVSHHDTVFTVHLGHRYKWSNGTPVTAYDALYDAQLLLATSHANAAWVQCGAGIGGMPQDWKSVTAPNGSTVVVTTRQPVNPVWFELNGIGQIYPIPKAIWDHSANWKAEEAWVLKVGVKSSSPQFRVVDGPYRYGPFELNSYATLLANPRYTGPDPAHIKRITLLDDPSEQNLWALALRGQLAQITIPPQYNSQRSTLARAGYTVTKQPYGFCINYAEPNYKPQDPLAPLFHQLYIRQAIQMGVNQQAILALADGIGHPTYGPVPAYPPNVYYDSQVAKAVPAYNPAKARRLLEAHGWHLSQGVMVNAKGVKLAFKLMYPTGSQYFTDAVSLWQQDLKLEGIAVQLQPVSPDEFTSLTYQPSKWQVGAVNGAFWCFEPDYYPTGAGLFVPGAGSNTSGINDPHLTALVVATHAPGTPDQVMARMRAYQMYMAQNVPVFWWPIAGGFMANQKWLHAPASTYNAVMSFWEFNLWTTSQH